MSEEFVSLLILTRLSMNGYIFTHKTEEEVCCALTLEDLKNKSSIKSPSGNYYDSKALMNYLYSSQYINNGRTSPLSNNIIE
jgi:hypothetical protein